MSHLRHWLITAALLSTACSSALAVESLGGVDVVVQGGPAGSSMIEGKAVGGRLGSLDLVLASHARQPRQRMEIGLGLGNDALANGSAGWYGVYLQSFDRVAERNTIYGLLRDTPPPGLANGVAPSAFCCQPGNTSIAPDPFAKTVTAQQVTPTVYLFGMLRKKGLNFDLDGGWKMLAGVRPMQYSSVFKTKVRFATVERYWDSFHTSYSFELERSGDLGAAPSHVLQFDYLYGPRDSVGVSLTNGREIAYFGSLGILNTETHNLALRGQHWFNEDWAFTYQAGSKSHGSLPAQSGVRMGVQHKF